MKIACLGTDRGQWGQTIASLAVARGHTAYLFRTADEVPRGADAPDYVFTRIPQFPPNLEAGIRAYGALWDRGESRFIVDLDTVRYYEDKLAQAEAYASWMPVTLTNTLDDTSDRMPVVPLIEFLHSADQALGYPFISKASFGSASANVRLIQDRKAAVADMMDAFQTGIPSRRGGSALQKDHLIWQQFLPCNEYDYRAVITGNLVMLLRRYNRDDRPMASGSGKTEPVQTDLNDETRAVLEQAFRFFEANNIKWGGIDLVCDYSVPGHWLHNSDRANDPNAWRVLETTLGWSAPAYKHCVYFTRDHHYTAYRGHSIFNLLLDKIEQGIWDR